MNGNTSAVTVRTTFTRETSVGITIHADSDIIWKLLTTAEDYPRWNSTVISIDGSISKNGYLKLKSTLDPKRTFKLMVKEFEPNKKLVWGNDQGNRTYTLTPTGSSAVQFTMTEKIGGLLFPLYAKYIPPFDKAFEQFAADLKKEAESIHKTKN
jgi:uncharacterized protein YndB with AHSA1/START domain